MRAGAEGAMGRRQIWRAARGVGLGAGLGAVLCVALLAGCGPKAPTGAAPEKTTAPVGAPAPQIQAEDLGAPATPEVKAKYDGEFEAVGAEPFWRLDLLNDYAAFTRPGLSDVGGLPSQRDFRANGARVIAGPLTIVLKAESCVHESGETFPYKAIVQFEGVAYEGCARRGVNQASADNDWTSVIGQLLPAIDACLAKADKKPARVTIAVRLIDAEGGRYECNAPAAGGAVTDWETIADQSVLQGERDPLFTRAPTAAPPKTGCYTSAPAKLPSGAAIGWYTRKTC
jgi:uncharacterized membrane protein